MVNVLEISFPDFDALEELAEACELVLLRIAHDGMDKDTRYIRMRAAELRRAYGSFVKWNAHSTGLRTPSPAELVFDAYEVLQDLRERARDSDLNKKVWDYEMAQTDAEAALCEKLNIPEDYYSTDGVV